MPERFLNIGRGNTAIPGFIHIDQSAGADLQHDVTTGIPFPDQSIEGIFCDNFIEYLDQGQGLAFLRECRRVLTPGGTLRILTPDLDHVVAAYVTENWQAPKADAAKREWIDNRAESLNMQMRGNGRQWLYNAHELIRSARFAGLDNPVRQQADTSSIPALASHGSADSSKLVIEFSPWKPALEETPLVSIVIPGYKARYFGAAIESALNQTYANIEILVLDDSSDEQIFKLIQASAAPQRIRYLKNTPRLGEAMSLTRGIQEARGQLIKPLYDDDCLLSDCVERMVAAMQKCPASTLAISRRYTINASGERIESQSISVANASCEISGLSLAAFTLATGRNYIGPPSSVMFRRDDALSLQACVMTFAGEFTHGAGDVTMYLNLLSRGDAVFLMDMLSEFRIHDDHTSSNPAIFVHERNSWIYLKHHGQRLGMIPADANIKIKRAI
ncbi:glycosyltransferase [Undibacterium terreum]|uniref:Glycosyl transferase family 2 n=1 Tax=Undibacterium terreum TaxID=1224302 RepID=A0A916XHZ0_9BURK|nr:glycosyltransferase [Undibacterium terreum]GGC71801.1 hypothetical protein GCM10011396_18580 [Undibacterium terreum]